MPIESGGVEQYILSLSRFLSKDNNNFMLLTDKSGASFWRLPGVYNSERIGCLNVYRLNSPLHSLAIKGYYSIFRRELTVMQQSLEQNLFLAASKIKGIEQVDVFHIHGIWLPIYPIIGVKLSQLFNRPFIVTLHGDSVDPKDRFSMPLRAEKTIAILKRAKAITTFSKAAFDVIHELKLGVNTQLIPNFIDCKRFARVNRRTDTSSPRVVMVTRLSSPKDPMTPIRAFAKVKKEIPEVKFQIVGYGQLYEHAVRLVEKLNLTDSVSFEGSQKNVQKYLWENDISVVTRGSYITTLEAWASGTAVVAPKHGIMEELIMDGKDGLLTPSGDIDLLASQLISLIKDKKMRNELIQNGLKSAARHDISSVAPRIEEIYRSVL